MTTYGNLLYAIKDNATKVVYIWSYKGRYPIAKIEGLSYSEVESALGKSFIDRISQNTPSVADINNIRTVFTDKNALVITYTYQPSVGMASSTSPAGYSVNYYYDNFNRLFLVRDDKQNILGHYRYGYQNAPDNGIGGYAQLSGSINSGTASDYKIGTAYTASISAINGSGDYTYSWYLKDNSGNILSSAANTMATTFLITVSQTGYVYLSCVIKDNVTGIISTINCPQTIKAVSANAGHITTDANKVCITGSENITVNGNTVNASWTFAPRTDLKIGQEVQLGIISENCRPSTTKSFLITTDTYKTYLFIASSGVISLSPVSYTPPPGFFPREDYISVQFSYTK